MRSQVPVGIAIQVLKKLRIPFRGPFITPKNNRIYLVNEEILTEPEIMTLHRDGELKAENRRLLLKRLQGHEDLRERQ
jgi:hypothetical protein